MGKTYKVAYNGNYGGFALSDEAVKWLEQNAREEVKEFLAAERVRLTESRKHDKYASLSTLESTMGYSLMYDFQEDGMRRHDPDLIRVIEELGSPAGSPYSDLKIAEISGRAYRIDEYDGWETISEPDDYNWIIID
jgi:hypothetical protein